jgi:hypothetical protein
MSVNVSSPFFSRPFHILDKILGSLEKTFLLSFPQLPVGKKESGNLGNLSIWEKDTNHIGEVPEWLPARGWSPFG